MSGTSWVGGGGKKPSSRPPSKSFAKKQRAIFMKAYDKKQSKFY